MKSLFLSLSFALLGASGAFGGNGNYNIGISAESIGLGGTGVANYTNTMDALFKNPALLGEMAVTDDNVEVALGASLLKLNASADPGSGAADSSAGARVLPNAAAGYRVNDQLTVGIGVFGYGGNAVNYVGNSTLFQLQSENRLVRVGVGTAYQLNQEVSFGFSPFLTHGQLNINEDVATPGTQSSRPLSNSVAFGFVAGLSAKPTPELLLAGSFVSRQNFSYSSILDLDLFGPNPLLAAISPTLNDIHIQTPFEFALGGTYTYSKAVKFIVDYRFINWADADVYRELNWQNQNVIALGTQLAISNATFRLGFNYAASPISNVSNENGSQTVNISGRPVELRRVSFLDLVAFPAVSQAHLTAGGGYQFTKDIKFDAAFLWAPNVSITRSGQDGQRASGETPNYSYTGSLSIWAISANLKAIL